MDEAMATAFIDFAVDIERDLFRGRVLTGRVPEQKDNHANS